MQTQIVITEWALHEDKENAAKKVVGKFDVRIGATVLATQSFNEGYQCVKVPFSTETLLAVERLGKQIKAEVEAYFTGAEMTAKSLAGEEEF